MVTARRTMPEDVRDALLLIAAVTDGAWYHSDGLVRHTVTGCCPLAEAARACELPTPRGLAWTSSDWRNAAEQLGIPPSVAGDIAQAADGFRDTPYRAEMLQLLASGGAA